MKENLTEIIAIADMSGSMYTYLKEAVGGFDAFINSQKELDGECKVSITMFDTVCESPVQGEDIKNIKSLLTYGYCPRGMTALNDAIGKTVTEVGRRLANTPEEERPSKVIVVIQTDGEENASREYSGEQIKEMIEHQESVYNWKFIFLGAGVKKYVENVAKGLGVQLNSCVAYEANARGITGAYRSLTNLVSSYRAGDKVDCLSTDLTIDDEDKK